MSLILTFVEELALIAATVLLNIQQKPVCTYTYVLHEEATLRVLGDKKNWTVEWNRVIFSDESQFKLFDINRV
ncbi:2065_t:CDS:2 [Paraglomus occultum]|uniref:2065_t:CDS:1 n=1 Tax=Paraglomus occultum TaxID=144539 RepID=A0A9N9C560_9GLOM|nr:2065_t:CDS:2 [Paraglomus occultum]